MVNKGDTRSSDYCSYNYNPSYTPVRNQCSPRCTIVKKKTAGVIYPGVGGVAL